MTHDLGLAQGLAESFGALNLVLVVVRLQLALIMLVVVRTVVASVLVVVRMGATLVRMFVRVLVCMGMRMLVCMLHPPMGMFMGMSVGVSVLVRMDVLFFHRSSPGHIATIELDAFPLSLATPGLCAGHCRLAGQCFQGVSDSEDGDENGSWYLM